MGAVILRRLLALIPLLLLVSLAVFSLTLLLPGDPAITLAGGMGPRAAVTMSENCSSNSRRCPSSTTSSCAGLCSRIAAIRNGVHWRLRSSST